MQVNLLSSYPTAEAERGKFAVIEDIEGYSGRGRYAVLTYNLGTATGTYSPDTATSNSTSGVQIYGGTNSPITTSVSTFTFDPPAKMLEISVPSAGEVYIILNEPATTTADLTATGIIIPGAGGFYSIDKFVGSVSIASENVDQDVRIHGHY